MVSEETGRISVAAAGELKQGLTIAEAEQRINLHFGVRSPAAARADEFAGRPRRLIAVTVPAEISLRGG